uniref:Serpin domain-containing protein n=1 Tax=Neolamprologus brichardi TaxID=32507 RepID=A0A3Q4HXG4_NEOBR
MDLCLTLLLIYLCSQGATVNLLKISKKKITPESAGTTEAPIITTSYQPPTTSSGPTGASSTEEDDGGCLSIGRNPHSKEIVAAAIQKMGVQLLQNLEMTPDELLFLYGVTTSDELCQELLMHHLHENTLPCYHQSLHSILMQLKNNDLHIATRIFLREGFKPKEVFVNESHRFYRSEPAILENLEQINTWVENATQGKIADFLSALPPNLLLMLINAVHFKGEWKARFDPRFTSRGVFYLDEQHMVDVEVMEDAKHPLSFFIDHELEAQVASFPFLKSMSLLVVVPMSLQTNISSLAAKIDVSNLYNRLPKERAVQVKVPKFKLEYAQELKDVFIKLGLGEIFSSPNLAEISDGPLLVSSVMHKSSMEINEDGAEAAAATTVVISRASNPVFHLSQPFFFALMHDVTKIPIFMGVINNPNPGAPVLQKGEFGSKDKVGFPIDKNDGAQFGGPPK